MVYAFFATRIRPQKHYLPKTFFSPKNTLQSSKAPYCRCQYGLLSPYFAALNTGSCYAIAPTRGQCAPPLRLCARAMPLRAYAYATRPYCRWQYGLPSPYFAALNTGFCRPISLRSIRALATLLPPLGGNALRRSGYVLAAPPLARIRLRNPPYCPWQYGPK